MKRGILLLGNPGDPDDADEYCEGVWKDLENYESFFRSLKGGAWEKEEIVSIPYATRKNFETALGWLDTMDYSMLIFSGHGWSEENVTHLALSSNPKDECTDRELMQGNRTIILDCCRAPLEEILMESQKTVLGFLEESSGINKKIARAMYEEEIRSSCGGAIVLYSCSLGECSNDDSNFGGAYSYELLKTGWNWRGSAGQSTLTVAKAHEMAALRLSSLQPDLNQHPRIYKLRRLGRNTYPFALKI